MIISFTPLLAAVTAVATANPLAPPAANIPKSTATLSPQIIQQLLNQPSHLTGIQTNVPWLAHIIGGIFILSAVALVILLAFQTTKQEGLSGTIGGRVEAAYRPRLGFDQQLARITTFVAITFVVFGTLVSITGT